MSKQNRINALTFGISTICDMHGSVVGGPSFPHTYVPRDCACVYGVNARILIELRKEMYKDLRESRKKRVTPEAKVPPCLTR